MRRASVRVPGKGADPGDGTADPGPPGRLRALWGALRLRGDVPAVSANPVPRPGCAIGAQTPAAARAVRRVKWLTRGGLVAALCVGAAVGWGLGWRGLLVLLAFFVSGSLLTQLAGGAGGQRTARQVLANGGVAAGAALFGAWSVAVAALAAATADTWATEIGSFSPWPPRLFTTWSPVPAGTSGGITLLGTLGGAAGAVVMAWLAALVQPRGV